MNKPKLSKKPWLIPLLVAVVFFGLITILYFFFIALPLTQSAAKIAKTKSFLEESRLNLTQNQVLYYQFFSLDPVSTTFSEDKNSLMAKLNDTNASAIAYFSESPDLPSRFYTKKIASSFIKKVKNASSDGFQQSKNSLEKQKSVIDKMNKSEDILKNIFAYDPRIDFENLSDAQKGEERAANAINNLGKIKQKLSDSDFQNKENTIANLESVLSLLNQLENDYKAENIQIASQKLTSFKSAFSKLKVSALELQKSIIKDSENLKLMAQQETQIENYQSLINEASDIQKELISLQDSGI